MVASNESKLMSQRLWYDGRIFGWGVAEGMKRGCYNRKNLALEADNVK